ncbi:23585_t:CDS:2 [Racocetra persica]|uniref:23585_t:CDS:1 n=1 Tax=Racocetra persica TaxID=160502 RepID=A0ACA9NBX7_9GLOM|nr:23585_t:CDS:2 [Racocetra persica]
MSVLINTHKPYIHIVLLLCGFVTKNSSAKEHSKEHTKKHPKGKRKDKQKKKLHRCKIDSDPCRRVNELSAPCNQTLPPPTSKVSIYKLSSDGNGNACNCNQLYYDSLSFCVHCMNGPGNKVSIQPLNEWKNSCIQHGTPFTEFPPSYLMPSSQLDGGNSTQIMPLYNDNNTTLDILIVVCVFETVIILTGIGFCIYYRLCYKNRNSAIIPKKSNNSKISTLKNDDVSSTSNTDNQLEQ